MKRILAIAALWLGAWLIPLGSAGAATPCRGNNLLELLQERYPANFQLYRQEAGKIANNGANLWRIEGPEGTPSSWLFGTIHVTDPRVTKLPAPVEQAIDSSRVVALELREAADPARLKAGMKEHLPLMMLPAGETVTASLDDGEAAVVGQALAARGVPLAAVDQLQPWVLGSMLAVPMCEEARQKAGELPLDAVVGRRAHAQRIPVVGLETIEEQLGAFSGMTPELQHEYLVETAKMGRRGDDLFETMVLLYLAARSAETLPLMGALLGEANYGMGEDGFNAVLIDRRNTTMLRRAEPLLKEGGAFLAVGALHLSGERGLVALLREAGYEVTAALPAAPQR